MHLWIVTTGSSDVQLISDKANQAKGRTEKQCSDKVWHYWYTDDLRGDCYDISFEPKQNFRDRGESYKIAPRVLGRVYQASDQSQRQEIWDYLTFPLLDNFVQALANYPAPQAIVVLLTDQSAIFESDRRRKPNSPYWQDTCELKPILQKYFAEKFPDAPCEFILLMPVSEAESLDNWDAVLNLVRSKFRHLEIAGQQIQVAPEENVYVSHQAGTPAISSAVQFCSLAKFGDRVKFLVSNEYNPTFPEKPLEGSSYLRGIRIQEAKVLLDRHDYSGVEALVRDYLKDNEDLRVLLNAAIQWNFAKFDEFANEIQKLSSPEYHALVEEVKERSQQWWWTAYEAAYLSVIRLGKQQDKEIAKDTVDSLFHSFRAIEGIFTEWGIQHFQKHIRTEKDRPYLKTTILNDEQYFTRAKYREKDGKRVADNDIAKLKDKLEELKSQERDQERDIVFYGLTVYTLFREVRQDWKTKCKSINRFWDANNGISEKRNKVFHQLRGLTENEIFQIWEVDSFDAWKDRMREFANFVSEQNFEFLDRESSDGQVASLMVKVHKELERAIAQL